MGFSKNKIVDYHVGLMYAPILAQLQANAKATLNDMVERIGLSEALLIQHIENSVIIGYTAQVNRRLLVSNQ